MLALSVNGVVEHPQDIETFGAALDRLDAIALFELWLHASGGAAMSMLRHDEFAFLMYLRYNGDSGFVTRGQGDQTPVSFTLGNGQVDEYPRSWCIPLDECYKALAYFFVNDGMRPSWIQWHES